MFNLSTRILVVDDMKSMRKMIINMIRDIGFTDISEATDGQLAWEVISKASPPIELIISDWNMPNCTGLELLKMVRGDAKTAKTSFLMITAEAEVRQVASAIKSGVDEYIVKPFAANSLIDKLEKIHKKSLAVKTVPVK